MFKNNFNRKKIKKKKKIIIIYLKYEYVKKFLLIYLSPLIKLINYKNIVFILKVCIFN